MEADYVLTYTALIIVLALLVSSFRIDTGSDVTELLVAVAEASRHPGTVLKVRLLLAEGAGISCDGSTIRVRRTVIPQDVIRIYRSYGIGDGDGQSITLNIDLNRFSLDGGYIYTIQVESTPTSVRVKPLEARKI